jgi:ribonuclease HII
MIDNFLPRTLETKALASGDFDFVIGVDEAGRGPLCGPVVAAACHLPKVNIEGVQDSKQISEEDRAVVYESLQQQPDLVSKVVFVDNKIIDEINILQATFQAMTEAVFSVLEKLKVKNHQENQNQLKVLVLIDGNKVPPKLKAMESSEFKCLSVIKGDGKEYLIAAASILAKVQRDKYMEEIHEKFPVYNLLQHKGYPTKQHMELVRVHGPCEFHRMTFAPLKFWYPQPERKRQVKKVKHKQVKRSRKKIESADLSTAANSEEEVISDGPRRSKRLRKN